MSKKNLKVEAGEKTRAHLVAAARRLFANGYESVGTPDIVAEAGVTRGALYHHFRNKEALFYAVVEEVAADVEKRIDAAADAAEDLPGSIVAGSHAFLSVFQDDEVRQVFLVDALSVLGWSTWREIDARHGLGSLKDGLRACAEQGYLSADDVETTAHLISGALNEAVFLLCDRPSDAALQTRVFARTEQVVRALLTKDHVLTV